MYSDPLLIIHDMLRPYMVLSNTYVHIYLSPNGGRFSKMGEKSLKKTIDQLVLKNDKELHPNEYGSQDLEV